MPGGVVMRSLFRSGEERRFANAIRAITGTAPRQLALYHLALTHTSFIRPPVAGNGGKAPDRDRTCASLHDRQGGLRLPSSFQEGSHDGANPT